MTNMRRGSLLAVALLLALAAGCTEEPSAPVLDNPFDQQNPDASDDPLDLQAIYAGNQVSLSWQQVSHADIADYIVRHSTDGTRFTSLDTVTVTSYLHRTPTLPTDPPGPVWGGDNWYKILARNSAGEVTLESLMKAAEVMTGPLFRIEGGASLTSSRLVTLTVESAAGDTVEISGDADFTAPYVLAVDLADSVATIPDWDLGAADADNVEFPLWARVRIAGAVSPTTRTSIRNRFQPQYRLAEDPGQTVASRLVDLQVTGTVDVARPLAGIVRYRFANSAEALATAPWLPYAESLPDFELSTYGGPQTVHAQFESDFGYTYTRTLDVTPDDLSDAAFTIADISELSHVLVVSDARATLMRFSENPAFTGASWIAYADSSYFTLSPGPGLKVVYGQFRNDWFDSEVRSDAVTYVEVPVEVAFTYPVDGAAVPGGVLQVVRGFAGGAGGALADSVTVFTGDETFELIPTTPDWEIAWATPDTVGDVDWTLRAEALSPDRADTAVAEITVTVTQLAVRIREPLPGTALTGGATAAVSGVASASLFGAPLDSVTVSLDGTTVVASGLESWSTSLVLPEVSGDTEYEILARVHAGGETATRAVTVTVQPPAPARASGR